MKWLLLLLGVCVVIALLIVLFKQQKNVESVFGAQPVFKGLDADDLDSANDSKSLEPESAAQRALQEGLNADDLDTAISKFTEAIGLQPDGADVWLRADAYYHRGGAYLDKKDLNGAIADFNEAIRARPGFAEAYLARGRAYELQGQADKAKTDFQRFDELCDPEVVRQLFKKHIPEIADGVIEIKAVARIGGTRTKIAVFSSDPKIDCIRTCVGDQHRRIKNIVDELGEERIDILRWNESLQNMIPNALQPAQSEEVFLYPRLGRAIVLVKEDQLSLAIGGRGNNVRLASKLVGWDIELMTHDELYEGIERAENWFRQIPDVTDQLIETFIEEGFLSYDDLTFVTPAELAEFAGVTRDHAKKIISFAEEAAKRLEAASTKR